MSLILKKLKTTTHLDPGPEGPRRSLRRLAPWRGAGDRTRRGGAEGAAPAPGGKFARCAPAGPGSRRSPGRGGAREARPGRARERKVPSGTRARAGIRAANEARVWAARGGGTGQNAAFAVAAAGALAASGAGGEATADRRAGRAPRPGPGVGNRAEELETFPAGNSRRPGAAAGLHASRAPPAAAVLREKRVPRRRRGRWGELKSMWESFWSLSSPPPLWLGTPGSFPGIGLDMLGAPGLGPAGPGKSAPSLRGPLRAGPSSPRQD